VFAIGSCTAYGGFSANTPGNPLEACGLQYDEQTPGGLLGARSPDGLPVVNIAGCPTHPGWVVDTLKRRRWKACSRKTSTNSGGPALRRRPGAPRLRPQRVLRIQGQRAKAVRPGCLMENLGCKGTQAHADCNLRPWNGSGSCLRGGFACIACTEPGFESPGHAFQETPKLAGIPSACRPTCPRPGSSRWPRSPSRRRRSGCATTPSPIIRSSAACARRGRQVTRIVLGPFNRVEGDLEVSLDLAGRVQAAYVNSPLFRGFEQILIGRAPLDALAIVPRICGICSVAQSAAAASALAEAMGLARRRTGNSPGI
jgi:hypothetical protein